MQDTDLRPAAFWDGCYSNIVGLPVCRLLEMLRELGHDQSNREQHQSQVAADYCGSTGPNLVSTLRHEGDGK